VAADRADVLAVYEAYLACCNEHRVDDLGAFVAEDVSGSGPVDGLAAYVEGVREVITGFPDYRWDLQQVLVDGDTVVARLVGRGTHTGTFSGIAPTGRSLSTQELVVYRVADGRIVNCWGDLYPVVRDALTTSAPAS
jgi:predicted ester cyclase